ncbi:MAG TPA: hypothetical protein VHR45_11105 [Thermoanaerobaculia bacterium]|nr:hypothetical protein [Thermoanaerobaculia bacterium]
MWTRSVGGDTDQRSALNQAPAPRVPEVPNDSAIVSGRMAVDQALLAGESKPVRRGRGDALIGGSINGELLPPRGSSGPLRPRPDRRSHQVATGPPRSSPLPLPRGRAARLERLAKDQPGRVGASAARGAHPRFCSVRLAQIQRHCFRYSACTSSESESCPSSRNLGPGTTPNRSPCC